MPSLIDIRRRLRSVRNTQQITRAMKMVSAAKLRRAQDRVLAARPYAELIREVLTNIVVRVEAERRAKGEEGPLHPLLARRPEQRVLALVVTGDKGLAGAFNTNVLRAAQNFLSQHSKTQQVTVAAVGRKGRDFFRRRRTLDAEYVNIFARLTYANAREIAAEVIRRYAEEQVDAVYLVYNEFRSVLSQKLVTVRLLPLEPAATAEAAAQVDYIYEQPPEEMFRELLPRYVEVQIFRALLESAAAEHAARMTAMDSATNNAADMIEAITLNMNRIRQATITKEIIEVVSGAAALG